MGRPKGRWSFPAPRQNGSTVGGGSPSPVKSDRHPIVSTLQHCWGLRPAVSATQVGTWWYLIQHLITGCLVLFFNCFPCGCLFTPTRFKNNKCSLCIYLLYARCFHRVLTFNTCKALCDEYYYCYYGFSGEKLAFRDLLKVMRLKVMRLIVNKVRIWNKNDPRSFPFFFSLFLGRTRLAPLHPTQEPAPPHPLPLYGPAACLAQSSPGTLCIKWKGNVPHCCCVQRMKSTLLLFLPCSVPS